MRKLTFIIAGALVLAGVGVIFYDAYYLLRYGFDVNDVLAILDGGETVDWTTDYRPLWSLVPAFIYGLLLCLCAVPVVCLNPELKQTAPRRSLRGAE